MTERIGGDDPGFELVEDRAAIDARRRRASTKLEREVLRLRFAEDLTQSKIAERVGYSQMHVSRILRRALGKLRDAPAPTIARTSGLGARRHARSAAAAARRPCRCSTLTSSARLSSVASSIGIRIPSSRRWPPPSTSGPTRTLNAPSSSPTAIRAVPFGNSSGLCAESASPIRTASDSSSTERSARGGEHRDHPREHRGQQLARGHRYPRPPRPIRDGRRPGAVGPFGESGIRIVTSVPRPGPPLISKLSVRAAISGRPSRRLSRSTSASGPDPVAAVAHHDHQARRSSR